MRKRLRKKKMGRAISLAMDLLQPRPYMRELIDVAAITKTVLMKGCSIPHTVIGPNTYKDRNPLYLDIKGF